MIEKYIIEKRYVDIPYEEVLGFIVNGYQNHINGDICINGINDLNIENILKDILENNCNCICFYCDKLLIPAIKSFVVEIKEKYKDIKIGLFTNSKTFPFQAGLFDYIKLGEFDENIYNLGTNQILYKNIDEEINYNNCKFCQINSYLRTAFNPVEENYFEMYEQLKKEMKINNEN